MTIVTVPRSNIPRELIFPRKVQANKKRLGWDDPGRLDEVHRSLAKCWIVRRRDACPVFNRNWKKVDHEVSHAFALGGFSRLLINAECPLRTQDAEALFRFYDAEGCGSMDLYDFLIGVRYNMGMAEAEEENILLKIWPKFGRTVNAQVVQSRLIHAPEMMSEKQFVQVMKGLSDNVCTTSELLFLFSVVSGCDRDAVVPVSAVARLLTPKVPVIDPQDPSLHVHEYARRLGETMYDPKGPLYGILGLTRMFRRADTNHDGVINKREFRNTLQAYLPLKQLEFEALYEFLDSSGKEELKFTDIMAVYKQEDYITLGPGELEELTNAVALHIRHRGARGTENIYNIYERHDRNKSGDLDLWEFFRAMKDLGIGGDISPLSIEMLFNAWDVNHDGTINWCEFIDRILGKTLKQQKTEEEYRMKSESPSYVQNLLKEVAQHMFPHDRTTMGAHGLLRIERIFDRYDYDHNGELEHDEFCRAMRHTTMAQTHRDISDVDLTLLFKAFDTDGSGAIDIGEFLNTLKIVMQMQQKEKLGIVDLSLSPAQVNALMLAVAKGMYKKDGLGMCPFVAAMNRHDLDSDGLVNEREFMLAIKSVPMDPQPSDSELRQLFLAFCVGNRKVVSIAEFLEGIPCAETCTISDNEYRAMICTLSTSLRELRDRGGLGPNGLPRQFAKYDTRGKGHLLMSEFVKAMRDLGCKPWDLSNVDLERIFYTRVKGTSGMDYDTFYGIIQGEPLNPGTANVEDLLIRTHQEIYGVDNRGSMWIKYHFNKLDRTRDGLIEFKSFQEGCRDLGSSLSNKEIEQLFWAFEHDAKATRNAVNIMGFTEALRTCVLEPLPMDQALVMMKEIKGAARHREQGLGGLAAAFARYDYNKDGCVDLAGFHKVIDNITSNSHYSGYEIERLFYTFAADGNRLPYKAFVDQYLEADKVGKRPPPVREARDGRELPGGYMHDNGIMVSDRVDTSGMDMNALTKKMFQGLYCNSRQGPGSQMLNKIIGQITRGSMKLDEYGWTSTVHGILMNDGYMTPAESKALFRHFAGADGMIDGEEFLRQAKAGHDVTLSDSEYNDIMERILDIMRWQGKHTFERVRGIFTEWAGPPHPDGKIDLNEFTSCLMKYNRGRYTALELELLFNHFSEDGKRHLVDIHKFCRAIQAPQLASKDVYSGASYRTSQPISSSLPKIADFCYNPSNPNAGSIQIYKVFARYDRDGSDDMDWREFNWSLHAMGVSKICTDSDLKALYDSLCEDSDTRPGKHGFIGTNRKVRWGKFLMALKEIQTVTKLAPGETFDLLTQLKHDWPAWRSKGAAGHRAFHLYDPHRTATVDLVGFTEGVQKGLKMNSTITPLDLEIIFDTYNLENSGVTGRINYINFLEMIADLPDAKPAKLAAATQERSYHSPRRQFHQFESYPSYPFNPSARMMGLEEKSMDRWHELAAPRDEPAAGGYANEQARVAAHTTRYPFYEKSLDGQLAPKPDDTASQVSCATALPLGITECETLAEFMALLNLEKYLKVLDSHEVELDTITELNEKELAGMGLPIGPRKKIMKAAKILGAQG